MNLHRIPKCVSQKLKPMIKTHLSKQNKKTLYKIKINMKKKLRFQNEPHLEKTIVMLLTSEKIKTLISTADQHPMLSLVGQYYPSKILHYENLPMQYIEILEISAENF